MTSNWRRQRGFTLVELMIVVVVIAIIAALALPAYSRYAFRARRPDGQEFLLRIANAQERYYATYNTYASDPVTVLKFVSATSEKGYYTVAITTTVNLATDYTATATPIGAQARDACGALSIDSTGTKLPASTNTAKWSNGRCW